MKTKYIRCGKWAILSDNPDGQEKGICVLTIAEDFVDEFIVFDFPYYLKNRTYFLVEGDLCGTGYDGEDLLKSSSMKVIGKCDWVKDKLFRLVK